MAIILLGETIIYDFRENQFGQKRLHQINRNKHQIEDMVVVDQNSHLRAIGIRPNKENWWFEKQWLGEKSFPVKFKLRLI